MTSTSLYPLRPSIYRVEAEKNARPLQPDALFWSGFVTLANVEAVAALLSAQLSAYASFIRTRVYEFETEVVQPEASQNKLRLYNPVVRFLLPTLETGAPAIVLSDYPDTILQTTLQTHERCREYRYGPFVAVVSHQVILKYCRPTANFPNGVLVMDVLTPVGEEL